jgi:hypothetical protein
MAQNIGPLTRYGRWRITVKNRRAMYRVLARQIKDGAQKDQLLSVLLTDSEFSESGCKTRQDLAYRPFVGKGTCDEVRRAVKSGGVAANRRFRSDLGDRSVSLSTFSFASDVDALAYLPKAIGQVARGTKFYAEVTDTREGYVEGLRVPDLSNALCYEVQWLQGPDEVRVERIVAGVIENMLVMLRFESVGRSWTWQDVVAFSELQVAKIRQIRSDA